MVKHTHRIVLAGFITLAAAAPPANAQWAVVDAPAIAQLIQEVQSMQQQLQVAQAQLLEAKQALQSMTGDRGMQQLLSGTSRNYLPTSWMQLTSASQGEGGAYPGLASDVRSVISANAVLSSVQLAALSAADQQQVLAARQMAALRQALAQQALANTSNRFAAIQSLIAAIGSAGDQKAILDLQTRTSAELGMLQNEQTKLQVLTEASRAQESSNAQRERELAIAGQGRFASRFQPAP
jgi:type IV secretion system protein VirB5